MAQDFVIGFDPDGNIEIVATGSTTKARASGTIEAIIAVLNQAGFDAALDSEIEQHTGRKGEASAIHLAMHDVLGKEGMGEHHHEHQHEQQEQYH